jgi:hypothetical protein
VIAPRKLDEQSTVNQPKFNQLTHLTLFIGVTCLVVV